MDSNRILIKKFFEEESAIKSNVASFNRLIEKELQRIVDESSDIEPTIIPHDIDEFKIKLNRIWVGKPEITEADGSKRKIYPIEARLRKITYAAHAYIDVSAIINGIQRENFTTQIASIPIMLKSNNCHLSGLSEQELIKEGEDPSDPGGYFIVNGTEKAVIDVEDLAANRMFIEADSGPSKFVGKLFSERGAFKIPHTFERLKDGIFYLSFTRVKRIPIIVLLKALGLLKDEEIMNYISKDKQYDEVLVNLFEFVDIKTEEDALDWIAKKIGITQSKEIRVERMKEIVDKYLLPHVGIETEDRLYKAYNLCKLLKRFLMASAGDIEPDDKDHYRNKRLKLSGDLIGDLFRVNLKVLIGDLLYNFQRIVKRGKFPSIKVIIRDQLLTSRIYSSMATGNWVGGRKGISQRMERLNYLQMLTHLQLVVSPLSSVQENFKARELHPTHLGRLCPVDTPEGTNIGLRKHLSILCQISQPSDQEEKTIEYLQNLGLRTIR